ncbi:MAG: hypothetical protein JWP00_4116 [Chloroflexi bacterium]|nr:hypothetical protein [Chloroflexota bacterium]
MTGDNMDALGNIVQRLLKGSRYEITTEENSNNFTVKFIVPQAGDDDLSDEDLDSILGGATRGQLEINPVLGKFNTFNPS